MAIDERRVQNDIELQRVQANPTSTTRPPSTSPPTATWWWPRNDHAIAYAGFRLSLPTFGDLPKSERSQPWNHAPEELRGMSDLVHACHAAAGSDIPLQRGVVLQAARRGTCPCRGES